LEAFVECDCNALGVLKESLLLLFDPYFLFGIGGV